jgi:hypothetical protein
MTEFEKWQKKALREYLSPNVYLGAELGWKAVLDWVLSLNSVRLHDDVYEDIKKELNHTLCVDHNHKTGKVRQLVCKRCNLFIGVYETDFYGLRKRIKFYLETNNVKD